MCGGRASAQLHPTRLCDGGPFPETPAPEGAGWGGGAPPEQSGKKTPTAANPLEKKASLDLKKSQ